MSAYTVNNVGSASNNGLVAAKYSKKSGAISKSSSNIMMRLTASK